jgi:Clp amino terminal domain, pathogenicity island component
VAEEAYLDPWSDAHREADARGLGYIGTDLVLLGLARSEGLVGEILRGLGATPEAITPVIDQINSNSVASPRPDTDEQGRPRHVRATPRTEHARGRAHGIAIGLGERQAPVHLLLAIAYDRDGIHASVLRQIGVSRTAIVDAVKSRGIAVPPSPPPRDADPITQAVILPDAHARIVVDELVRRSVADRAAYFDEEGSGRWGYGGVPERPAPPA